MRDRLSPASQLVAIGRVRPLYSRVETELGPAAVTLDHPDGARTLETAADRAPFVGRCAELAALEAAAASARAGQGAVVLVSGESGIGKTSLVREGVVRAEAGGARVLVGRCHDGSTTPYHPWIDTLRRCVLEIDAEQSAGPLGAAATDVVPLVAPSAESPPGSPPPPRLKSAQTRYRLFDGITTLLHMLAERRPLVLVLDDLQLADRPSLLLLRFVARECADARLLVIGAYRDLEVDAGHPLATAVAELTRHSHCSELRLGGLAKREVGSLMEQIIGSAPPPLLVDRVFRETDGNPFFVGEIVRLLAHEGDLRDASDPLRPLLLPQGVRAVISRRLGGLSPACLRTLKTAAVIGREFGVQVLASVTGRSAAALLDELGAAADLQAITAVPGAIGRFRFAHGLIRDTLYQEIASGERTKLHRQVGEALERLHGLDLEPHLAEIAHHFFEAARGGILDRALEFSLRAARQALALLAYEHAAEHFGRALQILDLVEPDDDAARCELLIGLGDARTRAADFALAKEAYAHAADLARRLPTPEPLARAALGFGMRTPQFEPSAALVSMLEDALAALGDRLDGLRARVLGRLARALTDDGAGARRQALCAEAIAVARRLGDPRLVADVLWEQHYALWHPDNLQERTAAASEIVRIADEIGDREVVLLGTGALVSDLLEAGDLRAGKRAIEAFARDATDLRQPRFLQWMAQMRATVARLEGRFEEAERFAEDALMVAERAQDEQGHLFYGLHLMDHRRYVGCLEDVETKFRAFVRRFRSHPFARCVMAWFDTQLGRHAEVRTEFEHLAANGFADLPKDATWLTAVAALAEPCALLQDAERAATLYAMAQPYGERLIGVDFVFFSPFSATLGRLATTLSRWEDAARHFEDALATCARMGSRPLRAMVQHIYAVMLLRSRSVEGATRAIEMLTEVIDVAAALGMTPTAERALALRKRAEAAVGGSGCPDRLQTFGAAPAAAFETATPTTVTRTARLPSPPGPQQQQLAGLFRKQGEYWEIALHGAPIRLKDSAGLRCVTQLLRHPRRDFLAAELAAFGRGVVVTDPIVRGGELAVRAESGDAGEALDATSTTAYRHRLEELRAEADEASERGDSERAAAARAEMEFLARELARGLGLRGRDRRVGSAGERARVNVTRTIKTALRRIAAYDAEVGRYLAASIRTGTYCSYTPDPSRPVDWTF